MNAYTVSRLALDAGVSVHIVRDYLLRGLLRPVERDTVVALGGRLLSKGHL